MYKLKILKNNIRIIYKKVDYLESINLGIFIKCGSLNEKETNNGISHLLEHMLFKETIDKNAKEIALATDKIGADINAYTSVDYTCLYMKVLSKYAYEGMDIIFDMIKNPNYSKENLDTEKNVIYDEIDSSDDDPDDLAERELIDILFKGNSFKYNVLGTKEIIKNISLEDVIDYKKDNYTGENIVLSVVGKFDEFKLLDYIESKLEDIPKGFVKEQQLPLMYSPKNEFKIINRSFDQITGYINIGPNLNLKRNRYKLFLLNNIFGGSVSSKLFQAIREDKGLTYNINSFIYDNDIRANINIYYTCNNSNILELNKSILKEIDLFSQYRISDKDLSTSRTQLISEILLSLEDPYEEMIAIGEELLLKNRIYNKGEIINSINEVDIHDMEDLKDDIFKNYSYNIIYIGNIENKNIYNIKDSLDYK